jgi:hypothetical protein
LIAATQNQRIKQMNKIDTLRQLVADIGKTQRSYHEFFPGFADSIVLEVGRYLGEPASVALCSAENQFSFDEQYRHEGLGFEDGRYRIPLMVRLMNLADEGCLILRVKVFFTKEGDTMSAHIKGEKSISFQAGCFDDLNKYIFDHLVAIFSSNAWFHGNRTEYSGSNIGFTV